MNREPGATGSPGEPTDECLVRAYCRAPETRAGREAADRLLRRYTGRVHAWCAQVVGDSELALDLAQDSLLGAYRALPRFREEARFSSWLFAIVRNRCRSHLRRPGLLEDEADPDASPSTDPGPSRAFEEKEGAERLVALMRRTLTPVEQEALWLRCFEKLPVDEITRILDLRAATGARGLLQTARRKLRAALERNSPQETENE